MPSDRWTLVKALMQEALELDPDRREEFLDARCATDTAVQRAVEVLLDAHDRAGTFLEPEQPSIIESEAPTVSASTSSYAPSSELENIGPYRILSPLGRGGMGVVYVAEQQKPIRRRVALKVMNREMDPRYVARFEAERQAMALMSHANVAKIFDAGATPNGRPYLVMELIKGSPITEHCDTHRLTTKQRLELFCLVCEGVNHAHQKGIIHRDLKPSNILVQFEQDRRIPKIIDFGIARAGGPRLTDDAYSIELGVLAGTPEYMSPEQADAGMEDIDTRTDVYALGVLLYQLMSGTLPFETKTLRQLSIDEIRRRIREDDPGRPSTRITGQPETKAIADNRSTTPDNLCRSLQGDLDWITMKAMEKDRTRRYGSPRELAADVQRFLNDEAVQARPPSTSYRVGKFVRRHRIGVAMAAAVAAALIVGLMGTMWGLVRATRAERQAVREAMTAGQVTEFLVQVFEAPDPTRARGSDVTALQILDRGAERIESDLELETQPEIQVRLMTAVSRVYLSLGFPEPAQRLLEKALPRARKLLGDDHPDTLTAMSTLGNAFFKYGSRFDEAEPYWIEALDGRRLVRGNDHRETIRSMTNLGSLYWRDGRYEESEPLLREALETATRVLGALDEDTLSAMTNLAGLYMKLERPEAEDLLDRSLDGKIRTLGENDPRTLRSMNTMASWYRENGKFDDAVALYERTLRIQEQVLGAEHLSTVVTVHNLGNAKTEAGHHDEAAKLYERADRDFRAALGPRHAYVAANLDKHAELKRLMGDIPGAERLEAEAEAIRPP